MKRALAAIVAVGAIGVMSPGNAQANQENWFIFGKNGLFNGQQQATQQATQPARAQRNVRQSRSFTSRGLTQQASIARQSSRPAVANQPYQPPEKFRRQLVDYYGSQPAGTIIINTNERLLYHVQPGGKAMRYGVGVGRAGFEWKGSANIRRKAEWPSWRPPQAMIERERLKGRELPAYMAGGPENPLGARALYLYQGGRDTLYRIHGTNNPRSIGLAMSSGCIRMLNDDVKHLYSNVKMGSKVVVL
ncbi:MAG: L,D-transpeptidase [Pseudomonadota bacterium]